MKLLELEENSHPVEPFKSSLPSLVDNLLDCFISKTLFSLLLLFNQRSQASLSFHGLLTYASLLCLGDRCVSYHEGHLALDLIALSMLARQVCVLLDEVEIYFTRIDTVLDCKAVGQLSDSV